MSSRNEYEMLFRLGAKMEGSYSSTFKNAQNEIASMQREIVGLSKTQSDISSYQKQQSAVEASQKKLETLQQQYDNIQKEIKETGEFSSALENKLLAKQQQIDKTSDSLAAQTAKLEQMGSALKEAGVDTDNLTGETAKLGTQIDELKTKQEAAADKASSFGSTATTAFMAAGQALTAAGIAVALNKINKEFKEYIDAAMEFETAMASVRRTVGGSKEEIAALGADFQGLSAEIPITTTELGKIAETAGQLGIARDDVYEFTEVMSMLATTTDLSADTAATMLAQFANITGLTDYERLGSTVADLGDATATTASKVVEMSQGMAAAASIAGFSETDILAVSAAVGSLGVESQAGSTAMSTLVSTLYKAVETGSDKLTEFADVAGMSANEFASAWRDDAVSAMDAFIQGLNDTERNGKSAIVILDELGITNVRQTKAILGLAQAGDLLSNTISQSNNAWTENTALQAKAGIMYDTTQSQLLMMQNQYNNLKVTIGDNYTPELQKLYAIGTKVLGSVTAFVEEHPELVKAVTAAAGVFSLAAASIAAYVAVVKIAIPLMHLFAASIPGLNIITGVVVGIAALAAAVAGLSAAIKKQAGEIPELTAVSREQYYKLQELNKEYETAKDQHDETSDKMLALRYEVDELTKSYEASKQTMAAFIAENDALIKAQNEIIASHSEAAASIDDEAQGALSLIFKLKELSEKTQRTATEQEQLMAIVDALNNSLPDLALNYDNVTGSLNMSTESLEHMIKTQAEQERKAESHRAWIDLYKKEQELSEQLAIAEENLLKRREELTAAGYNVNAPLIGWSTDLDDYMKEVDRLTKAYGENQNELIAIKARADEYAAAQENASDSGQALVNSLHDITSNVRELTEGYTEAYEAALESISGQYKLWDQAAAVVALSAGEINNALQSQIGYWQDYNENISNLTGRASDIEGLSEMIATFADGSGDSVRAIAGMAKASDTDLAAMVSNWKRLQDEQKTVSESLADLEKGFSAACKALQDELENTVGELDLSQEAAQSGKNLIQGFINGANNMLPAVQAAYGKLAEAAVASIETRLQIHSPSRVLEHIGENTVLGFNVGVERKLVDVQNVMRFTADNAVNTFTAQELKHLNSMEQSMKEAYIQHMQPIMPTGERAENLYASNLFSREYTGLLKLLQNIEKIADITPVRFAKVTEFAQGTTYAPDAYIAGERGPELILGAKGSSVFPAAETVRILSAVENLNLPAMSEMEASTSITIENAIFAEGCKFQQDERNILDMQFARIAQQYFKEYGDILQCSGTDMATESSMNFSQLFSETLKLTRLLSMVPDFARRSINTFEPSYDSITAEIGGANKNAGAISSPVINVYYDITGVGSVPELETMLKSRNNDIRELILETIEDAKIDSLRKSYF